MKGSRARAAIERLSFVERAALLAAMTANLDCQGTPQVLGRLAAEEVRPPGCEIAADGFSEKLAVYQHTSAAQSSVDEIYQRVVGENTVTDTRTVRELVAMYRDFGIDLSLGTPELRAAEPDDWCSLSPQPLTSTFRQPYSIDATFYHSVGGDSPRVALPPGFFGSFHVSTVDAPATLGPANLGPTSSDGWGIGLVISGGADRSNDPETTVRSTGPGNADCSLVGTDYSLVVRADAADFFARNDGGQNTGFIDATALTLNMLWGPRAGLGPVAWCATLVTPLSSLGNLGTDLGVIPSGFSELAALLREGEASDSQYPIPHALAGPTQPAKLFNAMVYPAANMDDSLRGTLWNGVLPYGALVQLDPTLDLESLELPLPAFRILEAIQRYGWYVAGAGVRDMDVLSNVNADEFGDAGEVDAAVLAVISTAKMYVVPPQIRRK